MAPRRWPPKRWALGGGAPAPLWAQPNRESRATASSMTCVGLAEREPDQVLAVAGSSWNTSFGTATTRARCGSARQNAIPSSLAERA